MNRLFRSPAFWLPFIVCLAVTGTFFAWELDYLPFLPSLIRPEATGPEIFFTGMLALLLSLNAGLILWQSKYGHCPRGSKRASGAAGIIGAITLICPACVLLPASLIGAGFFLAYVSPFLPLLRVISVVLLAVSTVMLWPKK
jgi:hypothetical protein